MDAYARRRHGVAAGAIRLDRRRIYILPTRFCLLYLACLGALYWGALNFGSNLAHALGFLLLGVLLLDMRDAHRQIVGLVVAARAGPPVFAGHSAQFVLTLTDTDRRERPRLRINAAPDGPETDCALPAGGQVDVVLDQAATRRGWLALPALRIATRYPLGLFRAWTWAAFDSSALVYPTPLPAPQAEQATNGDDTPARHAPAGDAELSHLREYRRGDPPHRIAWKALARSDRPLVKAFEAHTASGLWLDFDALPAAGVETRLSWLAGAVLDAERGGQRYGLILPGTRLPPGSGDAQRSACLRALALFGLPDTQQSDTGPPA